MQIQKLNNVQSMFPFHLHFGVIIFALQCLLASSNTYAFTLTISNRQYPGAGAAIQTQLDALANNMENQFNNSIASQTNTDAFLNSMGNANADSGRGYLSPGVIVDSRSIAVSVSGGLALALGNGASLSNGVSTPANQLPPVGVAAKTGISVGIPAKLVKFSIGRLDPAKTMYNLSFYSMDLSKLINHGVSMKSTQASAGMSYQFYEPKSWTPLIRFNGFRITTGLAYSSFDASYATPFNLTQTDAGTNSTMTWNSNVNIGVSSSIFSFTNEVTTGFRFLWIWNLYTCLGLDFNAGSSQITGGSTGPVTATVLGSTVFTGKAVVDGDSPGASPTFAQIRYLLGAEVDLGVVGIFVQGQISTPSVYGLNVGAHVLF